MNSCRVVSILLVLSLFPVAVLADGGASLRVWTSNDGKYTVEAEFLRAAGNLVWLKRADGRTISVPLRRLSTEDRSLAGTLAKQKRSGAGSPAAGVTSQAPRLDIQVERKQSKDNVDYDDKLQTTEITLTIKNLTLGTDLQGLKCTFLAIARDVDTKKKFLLLRKKSWTFDLPGGATYTNDEIEPITTQYDKKWGAHYGYKLYGHVVVVRDAQGKLLKTDSTHSQWLKDLDALLKIEVVKETFNSKLRKLGKPRRSCNGMLW